MLTRFVTSGLLLAALLTAADPAALQYRGYVNDFAGVLDAGADREISRYLKRVDESAKAQIAIVTIPALDGVPIDDFANELARRWGIGYKDKNSNPATRNQGDQGVLVLFSIRDRKMRIETGYGVEDAIPDGLAGDLLRAARPALRQNNYGAALGEIAHQLGERIAAKRGVTVADRIPSGRRVANDSLDIPWPVIIIGVIFLLWFLSRMGGGGRGGNFRRYGGGGPGVVFIPPFGGGGFGGRGSSSGGFGGYDSSDSFGGFGGGDFGGGGASSDW